MTVARTVENRNDTRAAALYSTRSCPDRKAASTHRNPPPQQRERSGGDRPERFAKAAASGASVPIIDLEDAVATAGKPGPVIERASRVLTAAGISI
jgi:hypothetical protein